MVGGVFPPMRRRKRRNLYLRAFVPRFKFHFRITAGRGGGYGMIAELTPAAWLDF